MKLKLLLLLLLCPLFSGGDEESDLNKPEVEVTQSTAIREADKEIRREYEAIHKVHMHLDDDHDGSVDMRESAEFIVEELHDEDNGSRQKLFHYQNHDHISVKDVWGTWYKSEVYNWTADEVIEWLCNVVHLPEYSDSFRRNKIQGRDMPRIAINGESMIQNELGVVDNAHRKKLELRAMDVVLFGPPRVPINWWKDIFLVLVLIACVLLAGLAVRERKSSQVKIDELMALMKRAEDELAELQQKMEKAAAAQEEEDEEEEEQEKIVQNNVERKQRTYSADGVTVNRTSSVDGSTTKDETMSLPGSLDDCQVKQLQIKVTKLQADKANLLEQLQRRGDISNELQQLLMLTYVKEHSHWVDQKSTAEKQLATARKECERIEKRRGTLLGSLRMINSPVLHDADLKINRALVSLKKVMKNLDEYKRRWKTIENLTGLHVVSSSLHMKDHTEVNFAVGESVEPQEVTYTSGESFDDFDETSIEFSTFGSTRSMDHPYQHQQVQMQQKIRRNMKHSASDGKLPSTGSFVLKPNFQRIDEDLEETSNNTVTKSSNSPSIKRRLFKKSKGNQVA